MKHLILVLLALAAITLAGCGSRLSPEEATEQFCASLQAFDESVRQMEQITANTTVGEARDMRRDVDRAWQQVQRAARNLAQARTDAVSDALRDLERTVDTVSRRDTLAEVAANVTAGASAVRDAIADLGSVSCPAWTPVARAAETPTVATVETPTAEAGETPATQLPVLPTAARVYTGQIPPSNGSAQTMTLTLHPDGAASMVFRPEPVVSGAEQAANELVSEGRWVENEDGTVSVILDHLPDGAQLATPEALTFAVQDGQLVAVVFDAAIYGPAGFTLSPVPAVAVAPESSISQPNQVITGTSEAATNQAGPAKQTGLTGIVWQLQQIQQGGSGVTVVSDPSQYTLILHDDGAASAAAECNSGDGAYQVNGSAITLQIQWRAASCPQTSLARQFAKYLEYANAFELRQNQLVIYYSSSSGQMTFAAAGP